MKFNKIMTVLLGFTLILMLGASGVLAGVFPNPFVINGNEDVNIIYGATGDDLSGANSIGNDLIATWDSQQPEIVDGDSTTIVIGDESYLIRSHGNDLNFLEGLYDVEQKLTEDELPILLADGNVETDDGEEIDYTQELILGNNAITFASLDEDEYIVNEDLASNEVPMLYLNLESSAWELLVEFDKSVDMTDLEDNAKITIAGVEYTINPNADNNDDELILYASTQEIRIELEETKIVTIDGKQVSINVYGGDPDDDEALLIVDGKYHTVGEGDSFTVNGERIYVNKVHVSTIPRNTVSVRLFIGADELTISEDLEDVEINGNDVDGVQAELIGDLQNLDGIHFVFTPSEMDEDDYEEGLEFLELGESIIDPLFGTIAMTFESIDTETLDSDDRDYVQVKSLRDELEITFTNVDRDEITFIPYIEDEGKLIYSQDLIIGSLGILEEDNEFILQISNDITDVFKIEDIDDDEVEIYSYAKDETETYDNGEKIDGTNVEVGIVNGILTLSGEGSNMIITENKMEITLNLVLEDIDGNLTDEIHDWVPTKDAILTFNELMDDDELPDRTIVEVKLTIVDGDIEITSIDETEESEGYLVTDSDDDGDVEYSITNGFGTYFVRNTDTDRTLEVYIPETEMDMNVYISAGVEEVIYNTDGNETNGIILPSLGLSDIVFSDNSADLTQNNLVVVGGSCINTVAAKLLGSDVPICEADFTDLTGVSEGQYIIKTFTSPYNSDKIAVLVAGYTKADTQNGVAALLVDGFTLPNVGEHFIV